MDANCNLSTPHEVGPLSTICMHPRTVSKPQDLRRGAHHGPAHAGTAPCPLLSSLECTFFANAIQLYCSCQPLLSLVLRAACSATGFATTRDTHDKLTGEPHRHHASDHISSLHIRACGLLMQSVPPRSARSRRKATTHAAVTHATLEFRHAGHGLTEITGEHT